VPLTPYVSLKIALNRWVKHQSRGARVELARVMGVSPHTVRQLLHPARSKASTDRLFQAALATGLQMQTGITLKATRTG